MVKIILSKIDSILVVIAILVVGLLPLLIYTLSESRLVINEEDPAAPVSIKTYMGDDVMKLPNKIRIGSVDYEVKLVKGLSADNQLWGRIVYGRAVIEIEESLPEVKIRDILAHELAHGLLYEAGHENHEEDQANMLGKTLAMMLRDNDFTFMRDSSEPRGISIDNINYE